MYKALKKTILNRVPKDLIMRNEVLLRKIYGALYSGKSKQCTVCKKELSRFLINERNELMCPNCGSLGRDRRLWAILENEFLKENINLLDFSPSRNLARRLKSFPEINYYPTDLSGHFLADYRYDITNLEIQNNTFDLICCYHILEHITDDAKAMDELFRVLKPNGKALIQTPFKEGETYEDATITSEAERLKHFGQEDHVRIYSESGLEKRLKEAGFNIEIRRFIETEDNYFGYADKETIFIATKP